MIFMPKLKQLMLVPAVSVAPCPHASMGAAPCYTLLTAVRCLQDPNSPSFGTSDVSCPAFPACSAYMSGSLGISSCLLSSAVMSICRNAASLQLPND